MKLGIAGLLPRAFAEIDVAAIRQVRALGFTGTAINPTDSPTAITDEKAHEIARLCASEVVEVVEFGHYQTSFVDPDAQVRRAQIASTREACRVASALGCPAVVVGIGSLNPAGNWFPHPANYAPATRERLVSALKEAAHVAKESGITLALECHVTTSLRNAATARALLEAVGSPALKVHLDPANWMTFDTIFETGPAISAMFDTLGPGHISGAHSKGVSLENRLIAHLDETSTGADDDLIDHAAVLSGLAALPGDPYLVIEHLAVDEMPRSRAHLLDLARSLDLRFTGQESGGIA